MNTPNSPHSELSAFVIAVVHRAVQVVKNADFQRHQSEVLEDCFGAVQPSEFVPRLMTPFYFLLRAHGTPLDHTCVTLGSAFVLIQRGVSLIDKVTDEELSDAWAELGPAVALNSGLPSTRGELDRAMASNDVSPWNHRNAGSTHRRGP